jgi:hypothetical protein
MEQQQALEIVDKNQTQMFSWSHHCPENFENKWHLVQAEYLRIQGDFINAMTHYNFAIETAEEQQFTQEITLAYEKTAEFYFSWKQKINTNAHLIEAYYAYARWGAKAKIKDMEKQWSIYCHNTTARNYRWR